MLAPFLFVSSLTGRNTLTLRVPELNHRDMATTQEHSGSHHNLAFHVVDDPSWHSVRPSFACSP